jgi:hypothetical protein
MSVLKILPDPGGFDKVTLAETKSPTYIEVLAEVD